MGEKPQGFTAVSFSLVRKYCVIWLYAAEFLSVNFVLYVTKNKRLQSLNRSLYFDWRWRESNSRPYQNTAISIYVRSALLYLDMLD